jgi:hypothetical protein
VRNLKRSNRFSTGNTSSDSSTEEFYRPGPKTSRQLGDDDDDNEDDGEDSDDLDGSGLKKRITFHKTDGKRQRRSYKKSKKSSMAINDSDSSSDDDELELIQNIEQRLVNTKPENKQTDKETIENDKTETESTTPNNNNNEQSIDMKNKRKQRQPYRSRKQQLSDERSAAANVAAAMKKRFVVVASVHQPLATNQSESNLIDRDSKLKDKTAESTQTTNDKDSLPKRAKPQNNEKKSPVKNTQPPTSPATATSAVEMSQNQNVQEISTIKTRRACTKLNNNNNNNEKPVVQQTSPSTITTRRLVTRSSAAASL